MFLQILGGGTVKKGTVVNLSCYDPSADIYYTLDGSTPTENSSKYSSSGIIIKEDCTLKAKAFKEGKSGGVLTQNYTIMIEPTKIDVYLSADFVAVGGTAQAYYSITPSNAESEITWTSDDPTIATINSKGVISGWKVGYTNIRAMTENGISGKCRVLVKEVGVKLAAVGGDHSLIVKEDGSLWSCGNSEKYQLFFANTASKKTFLNTGYNNIVSIAAGYQNSFYVDNSGSLSGMGDLGCIGANVVKYRYGISGKYKYVDYSALNIYAITIDGTLYGCGYNTSGQLGNGKTQSSYKPIEMMKDVSKVSSDNRSVFVIKKDGSLWACGANSKGKLGDGTEKEQYKLVKIMDDVASVATGGFHTLIVKSDGSLWGCGSNSEGQLMGTDSKVPVKIMDNVADVAASDYHSFIIKTDGSLWACGKNDYGQLGVGDRENVYTPQKIMDDVYSVTTGEKHTLIIKKDGSLWACGSNTYGQLGDGTTESRLSPVKIFNGAVEPELSPIEDPDDDPETPTTDEQETSAITIGKSGKASYCGDKSLDFSYSDEIKAYIATGFDEAEGTIWLTRVKDVPAGTPVLIKGEAEKTYQVPVTDSKNSYYTNMFKGNISGATVQVNETEGDLVNYYLSGDGTFKSVKGYANIGNNKSYLQLPGTFAPAEVGTTQTVTVGSAGKASYAAPVDLDFTNVEGLKAFTATGYDKSSKTIWLTRVMKVQKGEGVLLKGEAKDYQIPSVAVQSSYMNMFVGNTSGDQIQVQATSDDGKQTNFYLKGDGTFVSVSGYVNIGNNKCYLALPTSMVSAATSTRGESSYLLDEPEVIKLPISFRSLDNNSNGTTGVKEVKGGEVKGEEWFTLQGQRVQNPGKGIYIKNGKKVIIR